jgi:hypothetical protein
VQFSKPKINRIKTSILFSEPSLLVSKPNPSQNTPVKPESMATGWLQFSPVGTILNPSRAASAVISSAAGDFSSLSADLASIENLRVTGTAKVNNQDVATGILCR